MIEREEIYQRVWGYAMAHGDRSVDVFVRKLRAKLQKLLAGWSYIHTHFGVGYRFEPEPIAATRTSGASAARPSPSSKRVHRRRRSSGRRAAPARRGSETRPFTPFSHRGLGQQASVTVHCARGDAPLRRGWSCLDVRSELEAAHALEHRVQPNQKETQQ